MFNYWQVPGFIFNSNVFPLPDETDRQRALHQTGAVTLTSDPNLDLNGGFLKSFLITHFVVFTHRAPQKVAFRIKKGVKVLKVAKSQGYLENADSQVQGYQMKKSEVRRKGLISIEVQVVNYSPESLIVTQFAWEIIAHTSTYEYVMKGPQQYYLFFCAIAQLRSVTG